MFFSLLSLPSLFRIQHHTARTTTYKNVGKTLQDGASASADQTFLKDPRVNKFFLRVVALLDEVLEDGCGGFLRALTDTGNTCTADPLTKAPCDRFGIDLGGKTFTNSTEPRNTQSATQGCKRFDNRRNFQAADTKTF